MQTCFSEACRKAKRVNLSETLIDIQQLTFSRGERIIYRDLNMQFARGKVTAIMGPSGSGKTVLLQNIILDIYRDCFSCVFVFSPSIEVDATWRPVKDYIEKHMKVKNTVEEPLYFDRYDPDALANILETQHKITNFLKKRGDTKLFQI